MHLLTFEKFILYLSFVTVLLLPFSSVGADEPPASNTPDTLYIVPFLNVMIPDTLSTQLFDSFIDQMLTAGNERGISIRILKQDIDSVDKNWLAKQSFITGELFGYAEESGCCSTAIEVKVRLFRYQPGATEPVSEIVVPGDAFFDHDLSTLEAERIVLARRMAQKLSQRLLAELGPVQ